MALLIGTGPGPAAHLRPRPAAAPAVSVAADGAVTVVEHQIMRTLVSHPPASPPPASRPAPVIHHSVIPPASYSPTSIQGIIAAAAERWGVSASWMISIARCESGLRPNAYNPSGPYYGLFQFLMSTFTANGGTDIWSPVDQANITAKMLAHGQAWQWSCA